MIFEIARDFPNDIIFDEQGPCISLYQSTHRYAPEKKQNPIVFRNLMREIESSLKGSCSRDEIESIMKPFYLMEADPNFWNQTLDGLAVLANPQRCIVYRLNRPVTSYAGVASSFYIKPLIGVFQAADRYLLLGLNRNEFSLYLGDRYGYQEIEFPPGTPVTLTEVLGEEDTDPYRSRGTTGGDGGGTGIHYGHGGKRDDIDRDTEKFFRYVDRFVLDQYAKPLGLPLILVSLGEHHSLFREISHNPYLLEAGIDSSYEFLKTHQLTEKALQVADPIYQQRINDLLDAFHAARAKFLATDDLLQITKAAMEGRIRTVLLEADRIIPGRILEAGEGEADGLQDVYHEDLLNDIATAVMRSSGEVIILPKDRMPGETGAAAVFRYNN